MNKTWTKEDLECALDLTYLSMQEPCLEEFDIIIETSEDKMVRHLLLLDQLEKEG